MADITYIGTDEGWLYLAVVLDLFSHKVVGWSMSERMTATLVCDALRMALFRRKRPAAYRPGKPVLLARPSRPA